MSVRRPALQDLRELLALVQAADAIVWGASDWTEQELRDELERLGEPGHDGWVVELDGRLAGFATLDDRGAGRLVGDGYVHPAFRGRGVGTRLLELCEERAGRTPGARTLTSGALAGDAAAALLFRSRGYEPARHFWRMTAELGDAAPPLPRWPAGIVVTALDVEAHGRAFHASLNEAFAQEWDFAPRSFEEFSRTRFEDPRFDASLCRVAWERGEIAGLTLCDWKRNGDWGWVGAVAVRVPWRRRGLGEALLREAFGEFWRRGERRVALGVDAQNPAGATRLYERVGMRVLWEAVAYRKALAGESE
jgi:mycothiol synthase